MKSPREIVWIVAILAALLLAPTFCVLWFMTQAMRNEHYAVRQRLGEVYQARLDDGRRMLDDYWVQMTERARQAALIPLPLPAPQRFERLVAQSIADAIVILPDAETERPGYPESREVVPEPLPPSERWRRAETLEYQQGNPRMAAEFYGAVADEAATHPLLMVHALLARARCLNKAGATSEALHLLTGRLAESEFLDLRDSSGRFPALNAQLLALSIIPESEALLRAQTAESLNRRLKDYSVAPMPSAQRRFLMSRMRELLPELPPFPTEAAETLAAEYLAAEYLAAIPSASESSANTPPDAHQLHPSPLPGVWAFHLPELSAVALFRESALIERLEDWLASELVIPDARIRLAPPGRAAPHPAPLVSVECGSALPEWTLHLQLLGTDPFTAAAAKRTAWYAWVATIGLILFSTLVLVMARHYLRQLRLTRLKNDLIATVSHELKTPLSSMRVLMDSLLEGTCASETQKREYLELMARENLRLSRLIDNFLTFSRMERNKKAFVMQSIAPREVAEAAAEALRERMNPPDTRFHMELRENLPAIHADGDAVVTLLVNLLDNAHKYTPPPRSIRLAVAPDGDCVEFRVEDNGVGIPRHLRKRIFDRFFQVDQSLAREVGGCGLGLAIVRFIVEAHGGEIAVEPMPERGTRFRVRLPLYYPPDR